MPVCQLGNPRSLAVVRTAALVTLVAVLTCAGAAWSQSDDDRKIADSLAAMLRAGRTVISSNQTRINDPSLGPKGLDGATVLARSIEYLPAGHRDRSAYAGSGKPAGPVAQRRDGGYP